jgi:hypothetical protein
MLATHPFVKLRSTIIRSASQYRHNDDTSSSLFHPSSGFIHAYQIPEVETALDEYEKTLPTDFQKDLSELSVEDKIMKSANELLVDDSPMEVRDFARTVMAYFIMNVKVDGKKPKLTLLKNRPGVLDEEDNLDH